MISGMKVEEKIEKFHFSKELELVNRSACLLSTPLTMDDEATLIQVQLMLNKLSSATRISFTAFLYLNTLAEVDCEQVLQQSKGKILGNQN